MDAKVFKKLLKIGVEEQAACLKFEFCFINLS